MKDEADTFTRELPHIAATAAQLEAGGLVASAAPRGRGRSRKLGALTPAQRAKRYRDGKAANTVTEITKHVTRNCTLEEWPFPGSAAWYKKYPGQQPRARSRGQRWPCAATRYLLWPALHQPGRARDRPVF